jgi:hypothetical protein
MVPVEPHFSLGLFTSRDGVAFCVEIADVFAASLGVYVGKPLGFSRVPKNPHDAALVVGPALHVLTVFARADLPKVPYSVVGPHPVYVVDFTRRPLTVIDGPNEPVDGNILLVETAIKVAIRGIEGSNLSPRKSRVVGTPERRSPIVTIWIDMPPRQDTSVWIIRQSLAQLLYSNHAASSSLPES